ncbi:MAG: hypothetical protein WCX74_03360 [Candidatus Paceibacterota bacterium]
MEFKTSKKEINRRKKAFSILLASLFVGLLLASKILYYPISEYGFLLIAGILLVLAILTFRFLDSISKIKLNISERKIERMNEKSTEGFLFSDISRIKIKRRTNGKIREIYIYFNNKKRLFLTAFEESFESIKNILSDRKGGNVEIKETHEPIDFDHPLFYSILGLPISFFSIYFFKFILSINDFQAKIIVFIFSVYMLFLGLYFIFKKPISARYDVGRVFADYIFGIFMIFVGIVMVFAGLFLFY